MKIQNMTSSNGHRVSNQFVITDKGPSIYGNFTEHRIFQSYDSIIAVITVWPNYTRVELDRNRWDCSQTTGKYRNLFLGETKKETEAKIKSGEYQLVDLN